MKPSPAFQFYPGDFMRSSKVRLMTPAQRGGYIMLLATEWLEDDCGLPDDDDELALLSGLGEEWFNGSSTLVRKCFFSEGGRLFNKRLLEERKKQLEWQRKCSAGGKKSAKSRRQKKLDAVKGSPTNVSTKGQLNVNSSSSSSSSSSCLRKNPPTPYKIVQEAWNKMANETEAIPSREEMSDTDKTHLRARWKKPWWRENYQHGIESIPDVPFCCGDNDREWTVTFSWFLKPESLQKIFDWKHAAKNATAHPKKPKAPEKKGYSSDGQDPWYDMPQYNSKFIKIGREIKPWKPPKARTQGDVT